MLWASAQGKPHVRLHIFNYMLTKQNHVPHFIWLKLIIYCVLILSNARNTSQYIRWHELRSLIECLLEICLGVFEELYVFLFLMCTHTIYFVLQHRRRIQCPPLDLLNPQAWEWIWYSPYSLLPPLYDHSEGRLPLSIALPRNIMRISFHDNDLDLSRFWVLSSLDSVILVLTTALFECLASSAIFSRLERASARSHPFRRSLVFLGRAEELQKSNQRILGLWLTLPENHLFRSRTSWLDLGFTFLLRIVAHCQNIFVDLPSSTLQTVLHCQNPAHSRMCFHPLLSGLSTVPLWLAFFLGFTNTTNLSTVSTIRRISPSSKKTTRKAPAAFQAGFRRVSAALFSSSLPSAVREAWPRIPV